LSPFVPAAKTGQCILYNRAYIGLAAAWLCIGGTLLHVKLSYCDQLTE